jgi:hypothetical protein
LGPTRISSRVKVVHYPPPRPRLRLGATVAATAALLACYHRTPLTPVATDRTTMPNSYSPWLTGIDTIDPTYYTPGMTMGRRKDRARTPGLWIAANELPPTGGHPFYQPTVNGQVGAAAERTNVRTVFDRC